MSFENENGRISLSEYYLPKVKIKDCNVKIDGKNVFEKPINNYTKIYKNIRKLATGQEGYTTVCLLYYPYFKENYKIIAINLSKQQAFDADPRAILQINFTANLDRAETTTMLFILKK